MILNCDAANKLVKSLMADLEAVEKSEKNNSSYSYKVGEEPEIPEYSLSETQAKIDEINGKIFKLKHAINQFNISTKVAGYEFTVDEALVRLKVLNKRRNTLNEMRSMNKIQRSSGGFRSAEPEITKPNFSLEEAEEAYQRTNTELIELQQALNRTNLTETMEINI